MSLFRRKTPAKAAERLTRVFFASDFHGSQRIFRKFMNAAKHYEADVLIMGGDVVGKLAIPIIREGAFLRPAALREIIRSTGPTIELPAWQPRA